MVKQAQAHVARTAAEGATPEIQRALVDAEYHSARNLDELEVLGVEGFIPRKAAWRIEQDIRKLGRPCGRRKQGLRRVERMERKLRTGAGSRTYKQRGRTVEPVFGQLKHGFTALQRRGLQAAKADWSLLCMAHNLRKLSTARKAA